MSIRFVIQRVEALERNYLYRELDLDELEVGMKEIKNEKSPRPDGFLIEFCKQMWHVVDIAYLKVCQEVIK